jgi:hypothetical protein
MAALASIKMTRKAIVKRVKDRSGTPAPIGILILVMKKALKNNKTSRPFRGLLIVMIIVMSTITVEMISSPLSKESIRTPNRTPRPIATVPTKTHLILIRTSDPWIVIDLNACPKVLIIVLFLLGQ